MNVGLIGCGAWGQKRASNLAGCKLIACADPNPDAALRLSVPNPTAIISDYRNLLDAVDLVIVSVPIKYLSEITIAALYAGKHVLVEKPAARNVAEIDAMMEAEKASGKHVRVGFNLRYHRAFRKASEIAPEISPLYFVRARYGHGGREGYERDWRMNTRGGETLDQGVHLIDLASWYLGEFTKVLGVTGSWYWGAEDDNCFLTLQTADNKVASLQASCTEWRNLFTFEVTGERGKFEISGLGGSYGTEKITLYKKRGEGEPPDITTWEYPMADDSLEQEMSAFLTDIQLNRTPRSGLREARAALGVVEQVCGKS